MEPSRDPVPSEPVPLDLSTGSPSGSPTARLRDENRRLRKSLARWKGRALRDPLTGLPNRRGWLRAARKAAQKISRSETLGENLCVALFDLIDFKRFNDDHGLAAGDSRLQAAAQGFRRPERRPLIWARLGGDEFGAFGLFPASWSEQDFTAYWRTRQAMFETPADADSSASTEASAGTKSSANGEAIRFHVGWAFGKPDPIPSSANPTVNLKAMFARLYMEASQALAAAKRATAKG